MEWLLGVVGVLAGIVAATWMAYRAGGAEQRARTSASVARLLERRQARIAEERARIESEHAAASEKLKVTHAERLAESERDLDSAEKALDERTERPWPPSRS